MGGLGGCRRGWAVSLLLAAIGTMGFGNGVVFQVVSERFPKQIGMASGLIGAAGGLGGFLLPLWLGGLKDVWGTFVPDCGSARQSALVAAVTVAESIRRSHCGRRLTDWRPFFPLTVATKQGYLRGF